MDDLRFWLTLGVIFAFSAAVAYGIVAFAPACVRHQRGVCHHTDWVWIGKTLYPIQSVDYECDVCAEHAP